MSLNLFSMMQKLYKAILFKFIKKYISSLQPETQVSYLTLTFHLHNRLLRSCLRQTIPPTWGLKVK